MFDLGGHKASLRGKHVRPLDLSTSRSLVRSAANVRNITMLPRKGGHFDLFRDLFFLDFDGLAMVLNIDFG